MKVVLILSAICACSVLVASRQITFVNKCGENIWVEPLTNANGPMIAGGIKQINKGAKYTYQIPANGWAGRFWPKTGCNGAGNNCQMGQSVAPCPAGGCQPPADTKVEFFFPPSSDRNKAVWYDVSLVDGYSLPATIVPSIVKGTCIKTSCAMKLSECPTGEANVGDLAVKKNGKTVQCLSPCKKWNYPAPYGMGKPEKVKPGLDYCCPTPPVSSQQCRRGPIVNMKYVKLVQSKCPTAYSYAYDDKAGLHDCPNDTSFTVSFC